MIKDGITSGMMIDFNALKKSFPTKDTYMASLLDHSVSLLSRRITPRITPAITPKNVAIVKAFDRKKDVHPFFDGFRLYVRFRNPNFVLFSSMVRAVLKQEKKIHFLSF